MAPFLILRQRDPSFSGLDCALVRDRQSIGAIGFPYLQGHWHQRTLAEASGGSRFDGVFCSAIPNTIHGHGNRRSTCLTYVFPKTVKTRLRVRHFCKYVGLYANILFLRPSL